MVFKAKPIVDFDGLIRLPLLGLVGLLLFYC